MIARYHGTCACCHQPIAKGAEIVWSRKNGARHALCADTRNAHAVPGPFGDHNYPREVPTDADGRPAAYAYDPSARAYICPTCRRPNLSGSEKAKRYQCSACADAEEGPMLASYTTSDYGYDGAYEREDF
jgi:hypothetical protein